MSSFCYRNVYSLEFSVCSFNVRGLGNKVKREQLFTWLKSSNCTFCLLQDTHSGVNTHTFWQQEWGHEAYFSGNSNNSKGIGILINPKVSYVVQKYTGIIVGRMQALEIIIINEKEITLINLYSPNNDDQTFFDQLEKFINDDNETTFIVWGDFSTVINESIDKRNGRVGTHKLCRQAINNIIDTHNLIDIWRDMQPS